MNQHLDLSYFQSAKCQVSVKHDGCVEYAEAMVHFLKLGGIRAELGDSGHYQVYASTDDLAGWKPGEWPLCLNIAGRDSGDEYRTSFTSFYQMVRAMNGIPSYGSWFK